MRLQLRSMARYLNPEHVSELVVINNDVTPLDRRRARSLHGAAGMHAERLRLVERSDLPKLPPTTGWRSQQILKLEIARAVETAHYVVLDAKNHLVRASRLDDLLGSDGRARGGSHTYETHPLRDYLVKTLDLLDLPHEPHLRDFPTTATPFVLDTSVTRDLLDNFRMPGERTFAGSFERSGVTEFFLYSGWIHKRGLQYSNLYDGVPIQCPIVWPASRHRESVARACAEVSLLDAPYFAAHRKALGRMPLSAQDVLAQFWWRRGLFDSTLQARRFLAAQRLAYLPMTIRRKWRERNAGQLS